MLGGGRIEGEVALNTVPPVETAELRFGAGLGDGWGGGGIQRAAEGEG